MKLKFTNPENGSIPITVFKMPGAVNNLKLNYEYQVTDWKVESDGLLDKDRHYFKLSEKINAKWYPAEHFMDAQGNQIDPSKPKNLIARKDMLLSPKDAQKLNEDFSKLCEKHKGIIDEEDVYPGIDWTIKQRVEVFEPKETSLTIEQFDKFVGDFDRERKSNAKVDIDSELSWLDLSKEDLDLFYNRHLDRRKNMSLVNELTCKKEELEAQVKSLESKVDILQKGYKITSDNVYHLLHKNSNLEFDLKSKQAIIDHLTERDNKYCELEELRKKLFLNSIWFLLLTITVTLNLLYWFNEPFLSDSITYVNIISLVILFVYNKIFF